IAGLEIGGVAFDAIDEIRIGQQSRERHLDAVVEGGFLSAVTVEIHQRNYLRRTRRATGRFRGQRSDDSLGPRRFVRRAGWTADENLATARRIESLRRIKWSFDTYGADMREVCETRRGSGLDRVAHKVLVEVKNWSEVRLQESDAQIMRSRFRRQL